MRTHSPSHRPSGPALIITAYIIWMAIAFLLVCFFIVALHFSFRDKHRGTDQDREKPKDDPKLMG